MSKHRGLGRGLDSLLPSAGSPGGVREVPIVNVKQNPRQPRTYFDQAALEELAISIREHGIIQPLIVSERGEGQYELVAGERRWRAAQLAGLERVPVIIRETTPQQLLELALIENVQRADLNPLEEARAYQALQKDFGLSDSQIAQRVGKNSRETIANTRRLLNLPPQAQESILKNEISAGHGRALLKIEQRDTQLLALEAIKAEDFSVREAERLGDLVGESGGDLERALATLRERRAARGARASAAPPAKKSDAPRAVGLSPDDLEVRQEMERLLGTPVNLARTEHDLRVTIFFHTEEKLQEFLDLLNAAQVH